MLSLLSLSRSLMGILFFFIITFFSALILILFSFIICSRSGEQKIILFWSRSVLWVFGIRVQVEGQNNMPPKGAIFLFNHSSLLDIPVLYVALPRVIRFGAKSELFKIPIFGWALRRAGVLEITRENREKVIYVYRAAEKRILEEGESFLLAPEGGRNKGELLRNFKSGPFVFAINVQAPLVPVVIKGLREILPAGHLFPRIPLRGVRVNVFILPYVSTNGFGFDDRLKIKENIFQNMLSKLLN